MSGSDVLLVGLTYRWLRQWRPGVVATRLYSAFASSLLLLSAGMGISSMSQNWFLVFLTHSTDTPHSLPEALIDTNPHGIANLGTACMRPWTLASTFFLPPETSIITTRASLRLLFCSTFLSARSMSLSTTS